MEKFKLGQVVITCGAEEQLSKSNTSAATLVLRHSKLEKGELCKDDYQENLASLTQGNEGRIFSHFKDKDGESIWVITEWDRSVTTILLPSEY